MNRTRRYIIAALLAAAAVATAWGVLRNTPHARRERLVASLLDSAPPSWDQARRNEIRGLFRNLWARYDRGLVAQADMDTVETRAHAAIRAGRISEQSLIYLMAQVGYFTYRGEQKYNLPDSSVDHPTLNPDADVVTLYPDSTAVKEFNAWLAEMQRQGKDPEKELQRLREEQLRRLQKNNDR